MKRTYHIIQELEGGVPNDPVILDTLEQAGSLFEERVSSKDAGFRKKRKDETWEEFEDAFSGYTYSDDVAYDTCDWEIHWYKLPVDDLVTNALYNLYWAIIEHSNIVSINSEDIRNEMMSARNALTLTKLIE